MTGRARQSLPSSAYPSPHQGADRIDRRETELARDRRPSNQYRQQPALPPTGPRADARERSTSDRGEGTGSRFRPNDLAKRSASQSPDGGPRKLPRQDLGQSQARSKDDQSRSPARMNGASVDRSRDPRLRRSESTSRRPSTDNGRSTPKPNGHVIDGPASDDDQSKNNPNDISKVGSDDAGNAAPLALPFNLRSLQGLDLIQYYTSYINTTASLEVSKENASTLLRYAERHAKSSTKVPLLRSYHALNKRRDAAKERAKSEHKAISDKLEQHVTSNKYLLEQMGNILDKASEEKPSGDPVVSPIEYVSREDHDKQYTELKAQNQRLEEHNRKLEQQLTEMALTMDSLSKGLESTADIPKKHAAVESRVQGLERRLEGIDEWKQGESELTKDMQARLEKVETKSDANSISSEKASEVTGELQKQIMDVQDKVSKIRDRTTGLEEQMTSSADLNIVHQLQSSQKSLEQKLTSFETKLWDEIADHVIRVRAGEDELRDEKLNKLREETEGATYKSKKDIITIKSHISALQSCYSGAGEKPKGHIDPTDFNKLMTEFGAHKRDFEGLKEKFQSNLAGSPNKLSNGALATAPHVSVDLEQIQVSRANVSQKPQQINCFQDVKAAFEDMSIRIANQIAITRGLSQRIDSWPSNDVIPKLTEQIRVIFPHVEEFSDEFPRLQKQFKGISDICVELNEWKQHFKSYNDASSNDIEPLKDMIGQLDRKINDLTVSASAADERSKKNDKLLEVYKPKRADEQLKELRGEIVAIEKKLDVHEQLLEKGETFVEDSRLLHEHVADMLADCQARLYLAEEKARVQELEGGDRGPRRQAIGDASTIGGARAGTAD